MPSRNFLVVLTCLHALLAPAQARSLYTVNLLAGIDFAPTGMNNAGKIVGFADSGAGTIQAVLYPDGVYGAAADGTHAFLYGGGRMQGLGNIGSAVREPVAAWLCAPGLLLMAARCRRGGGAGDVQRPVRRYLR